MFMTFFVLKFFRSSDVSVLQLKNIELILVTFCVLKCCRSREVSAKQLSNIELMSVTFCVLENYEIELMPYDHWLGSRILPQTITSFVMPNHPAIEALIPQVGAMLKQMTGTSALIEYQSGNSNDVRAQVAAAFATVHQQGVVYRSMPASYEVIGQRVTMPDQVLAKKLGNCIELTLLMASVLRHNQNLCSSLVNLFFSPLFPLQRRFQ